jgi:DNA-binding NarL/FixJ family response regulator
MPSERILVIENYDLLAQLMVEILSREPGFEVVGVARTFAEARAELLRNPPDVFIQDLALPDISGFDAIRVTLDMVPSARILLLIEEAHQCHKAALKLGARSSIRKDLIATDLLPAVREIINCKTSQI